MLSITIPHIFVIDLVDILALNRDASIYGPVDYYHASHWCV